MYLCGVWCERLCISVVCEVCEVSNSSIVKLADYQLCANHRPTRKVFVPLMRIRFVAAESLQADNHLVVGNIIYNSRLETSRR